MSHTATQVQLKSAITKTSDAILKRYQENHYHRYFPKEWIYKNLNLGGKTVLDFGCGTGEITTQLVLLGAERVYGVDVTQGLLDATHVRSVQDQISHRVELFCGRIQDIEPKQVDVIVAHAVLHHCFPHETLMPALMRWLKPGGIFVAVEPTVRWTLIETLRNLSGISGDPLDEGERKLTSKDLKFLTSKLSEPKVVPFHVFGRLARLFPAGDMLFRRVDQALLKLPFAEQLAGTAVIYGRKPYSRAGMNDRRC